MKSSDSSRYFDAKMQMGKPIAFLISWYETISQLCRGKPFSIFFLSIKRSSIKEKLLNWLDFWSPGNHDDRTIAILY
jgi:hypothetical protein